MFVHCLEMVLVYYDDLAVLWISIISLFTYILFLINRRWVYK